MKRKIGIIDTVLRDAHQSLIATRMTTPEMLPILPALDAAGYRALEVWGGATFDACLRFLDEDPWERLRIIRSNVKKTKLQMLLRGQNILGYKHYPDDVVEAFVEKAITNGIDVVRVFDALNDTANLRVSMEAIKKYGGECQACICYTISPVHTTHYYVELVKELTAMGADNIAIKDMAGILTPGEADILITAIRKATQIPLEIHTHCTSGIAEMTYLKAIEAGADYIDTAISPFAGGTSQPSTESMAIALEGMGYETGLDMEKLREIADHFKVIRDKYRDEGILNPKVTDIAPDTLISQIPGGMLSNLLSQLKEAGQSDKFDEVLKEVPIVREDMGYPPLVTPMSQMVGTQALMNIISGQRYKMVPKEIKDYVKGLYGKTPAPISDSIRKLIIGDEAPITHRPADDIPPAMDSYKNELGELAQSVEDVLMYALFPTLALPFLKKRSIAQGNVPVQNITIVF